MGMFRGKFYHLTMGGINDKIMVVHIVYKKHERTIMTEWWGYERYFCKSIGKN